MNLKISASGFEDFPLLNEVPKQFSEYYIPGSEVISCVGGFGSFLQQYIDMGEISFTYCIFDIRDDVQFSISTLNPSLICHFCLKGRYEFEVKFIDRFNFLENQFNIYYTQSFQKSIFLKKGTQYVCMYISYPVSFILYALNFFPALDEFHSNIRSLNPASLKGNLKLNVQCIDFINKLIRSPFSYFTKNYQINISKRLLFAMLKQALENNTDQIKFMVEQVDTIHAAKEFIDGNLPYHFSIPHIARKVGINEQKLKKGFKEIFGMGLYAYRQEEILKMAKCEVEQTTKPVKQIALRNGYKNANNFSSAFKKRFGMSPLEWRKQACKYENCMQ
ncbi:MAG TPA: AraC family transcriptional regulator [Parafilimonas sp.]|nr:AraC family transcriptional regulator [Parafilimonas sp.]